MNDDQPLRDSANAEPHRQNSAGKKFIPGRLGFGYRHFKL